MKPIKPAGTVRKEPSVSNRERDSMAYRLATEGVTSTPEYIAMIDEQVVKGNLNDIVTDAIRIAVVQKFASEKKSTITIKQLERTIQKVAAKILSDTDYIETFKHGKRAVDAMIKIANGYKEKYRDKAFPVLEGVNLTAFKAAMDTEDSKTSDQFVTDMVDRFIKQLRSQLLANMGVTEES